MKYRNTIIKPETIVGTVAVVLAAGVISPAVTVALTGLMVVAAVGVFLVSRIG